MDIIRQKSRFFPPKGSNYYELNTSLSENLVANKNKFINKKILDIGAGEIPFNEFYKDLDVTTCDIQNNSTGTIDNIIKVDGLLPYEDNFFDVIFLFDVLEHIKHDIKFLLECNRVLTSKGIIVVSVPFMYRFHEIPYDYRRYTPSGLEVTFNDSGFKIIELKNVGSFIFTAQTMLLEHQVKINNLFRKIILKVVVKLLDFIKIRSEISKVAPFNFFCIAQKK